MASQLSEAEKRRILRERRQKKFSNGGASSRLGKITGETDKSFLASESPLDAKKPLPKKQEESSSRSDVEESTKQMDELLASISTPSKNQQNHGKKQTHDVKNPEMDLFSQLAKMQQENPAGFDVPDTGDLFSQFLKSAQQQGPDSVQSPGVKTADPTVIELHFKRVNRIKSITVLLRWIILLPYLVMISKPRYNVALEQHSLGLSNVFDRANFFTVFTTFELVALSIYFQRVLNLERETGINTLESGNKILKLVSFIPEGIIPIPDLRGKISQAVQYWGVVSMYLTDLCFAIVIIGVVQYLYS
ncbi:LAMI_0E10814g1_1 [Lachancea mirantina]|uniref:Golgi to ER traffic protein 2 n=1 Tax=Lachancea mirantina TaxID=1230905 RepID=A0A1G4JP68_9SACH|nr:LAMI_0E10814g1_1 [Lachancea mirantina]